MILESTPSRTSQVVAMIRAGLDRQCSPDGNPDAQTELCRGMRPADAEWFTPHMAARTRFVDDQVQEAINDGIEQIVVLGAGYDDRALRFATPGVRFFEVDHPATQRDKRRRLQAISCELPPVLVAADFVADDLFAVLDRSGHDLKTSSLFVCEGLLVYLEPDEIVVLLSTARRRSTEGSRLVASLAIHVADLPSDQVVDEANRRRSNADVEPWRTILPIEQHIELVARSGWVVDLSVDAADIEMSLDHGRSLLVRALAL